jgi:hypothetical protein
MPVTAARRPVARVHRRKGRPVTRAGACIRRRRRTQDCGERQFGADAPHRERAILDMLTQRHALVGQKEVAGTFDGFTESWVRSSYPAHSPAQ